MTSVLFIVWLFFAALFFYLAYVHWRQTSQDIQHFQIRKDSSPPGQPMAEGSMSSADEAFVSDFNNYLDKVNTDNRSRNRAATAGYFVAGIVALASVLLIFGVPR